MILKSALGLALSTAVVLSFASMADAQTRNTRSGATVTACSQYGNGCQTVPLRRGANDDEFRLPGGTWMRCKQSCKDTLRREVIDFWETLREDSGDGNLN